MNTEPNGDGRDKTTGRFAPGGPGGPGRPRREVEAAYLAATMANVTAEAWGRIVARAVRDAEAGDDRARNWLARIMGLYAPARVAATDPDGGPLTLAALLLASQELEAPEPPAGPHRNVVDVGALLAGLEPGHHNGHGGDGGDGGD